MHEWFHELENDFFEGRRRQSWLHAVKVAVLPSVLHTDAFTDFWWNFEVRVETGINWFISCNCLWSLYSHSTVSPTFQFRFLLSLQTFSSDSSVFGFSLSVCFFFFLSKSRSYSATKKLFWHWFIALKLWWCDDQHYLWNVKNKTIKVDRMLLIFCVLMCWFWLSFSLHCQIRAGMNWAWIKSLSYK